MPTRFVRHAAIFISTACTLAIALNCYLTYHGLSQLGAESEKEQLAVMETIVANTILNAADKGLARAELFANLPSVVDAMVKQDRTKLQAVVEPLFKAQKAKYGMDRAQVYVPPATMFLRVHAPERFGDNVIDERKMIAMANSQEKNVAGVEIGSGGVALYSVSPIKADDKFLGSFEVALEYEPIVKAVKAAYGFDVALIIDQKILRSKATKLDPSLYEQDNMIGGLVNYYSTNWELVKQGIRLDRLQDGRNTQAYKHYLNQTNFGVVMVPLTNFSGDVIGRVVAVKDFAGLMDKGKSILLLQVMACLLSVVLIIGIINILIRGSLVRPLADIVQKITDHAYGKDTSPLNSADFVAELQPIVALHDKITAQPPLGTTRKGE